MPIYEYRCTKCKKEFEVIQRITDEPLAKCSECEGELKKLITNTSFVLKGEGWYVTDHPSDARKKAMDRKKLAGKGDKAKGKKSGTSRNKEVAKTK